MYNVRLLLYYSLFSRAPQIMTTLFIVQLQFVNVLKKISDDRGMSDMAFFPSSLACVVSSAFR
jgi:hypothetical protein